MRLSKDTLSGALFVVLGLAAMFLARNYPLGTARSMGPGYAPMAIGGLVSVLGAVLLLRSLRAPGQDDVPDWAWRPLAAVLASVITFGLTVRSLGLVPAVVAVVLIVKLAEKGFKPVETLAVALGLAALCTVIFVYALGIPMKVLP